MMEVIDGDLCVLAVVSGMYRNCTIARTIENIDAREAFTERVSDGIKEIEAAKREAIKDRKIETKERKAEERGSRT